MQRMKVILLLMILGFSSLVYAVAPVVDAYDDDDDDAPPPVTAPAHRRPSPQPSNTAATFSLPQRVSILERQMNNLNPLSVTMDDLTQQLQTLQGKVEQQQFRLKQLEEQIRIQYQGLAKRLAEQQDKEKILSVSKAAAHSDTPERSSVPRSATDSLSALKKPSAVAAHTPVPTPASERAYQAAFQLLRSKQYSTAIEAFEAFIKKYPSDLNRANASYFLGQLYLLQAQPERAIYQFNHFVSHYSQDTRIPDALLQLGLAYFAKGDKTVAIDTFKKIIQKYPDTSAAESAKARIQQFEAMVSAANHLEKKKKT